MTFNDDEKDEYFGEFEVCWTKDCIMPGAHFESECHTAEDVENHEVTCRDLAN